MTGAKFFSFCILLLLTALLPAQTLTLSVDKDRLQSEDLKAIMVSNQYGVLRYFAFAGQLPKDSSHTFQVRQRVGEALALTLVEQVEDQGYYSFENTTYIGLKDGAIVGSVNARAKAPNYRPFNVRVADVNGVEEFQLFGPLTRRPEYRVNRGILNISAKLEDDAGIFAVMRLPGENFLRHFTSPMTADNNFELSREGLGKTVYMGKIAMPYKTEWQGTVKGLKDGAEFHLFNSAQGQSVATDTIRYFLPGGVNFDSLTLFLSDINNKGIALYGTYKEALPARIDTFSFEPSFLRSESKSFTFAAGSDEGQHYAISYYYSLGQGRPLASWHLWGKMEGMDQVDFILPDIPEELYEIIPELAEIASPIAIDKNSFFCTQYCDDYDFSVRPALLETPKWRMRHGMVARRKLKELEE
ncbi:MAG: hypothetical protein RIC19_21275 [Phaeodactylibacter sp.]|uniref:hypothetical protein n=1 Tax=Phaeodactylibacter sp. TaxID=1940289 RepID=UPI0032F06956